MKYNKPIPENQRCFYAGTPDRFFNRAQYIYLTQDLGESVDPCPECGEELVQDIKVDKAGCQSEIGEPYCEECKEL